MLRLRRSLGFLALLLLLAPTALADDDREKQQAVRRDFRTLRTGVALYALGTGKLPAALTDLVRRTELTNPALAAVPADPWKRSYIYERLGERRFRLVCLGQDGTRGSADDVVWPPATSQGGPLSQAKLVSLLIEALDSNDARLADECRSRLIALPRELPGLDDDLVGVLTTSIRPWGMRKRCADILVQRRKTGRLEKALREGTLDTRAAVLTAIATTPHLVEMVDHPEMRVEATIRAWLARKGDPTRGDAIMLANRMRLKEAMPLIRPLLVRPPGSKAGDRDSRLQLVQAGTAVAQFGDCESLPALATLARDDPDELVRLRSLQTLNRVAFGRRAKCAGRYPDEAMRALLGRAVRDEARPVRMAALLVLKTNATWAGEHLARVRRVLADKSAGAAYERRLALDALAAGGADLFVELPRHFHDPDPGVRMQAVTLLATRRPPGMAGCLIGILARERTSASAFHQALNGLRLYAGRLVGFPKALQADNARARADVQRAMQKIFSGGTALGLDRTKLVDGWLQWLCVEAGVTDQTAAVRAARTAFWAAAERNDVDAARAALAGLPAKARSLLTHERGWLER